jgi:hypothetical protein
VPTISSSTRPELRSPVANSSSSPGRDAPRFWRRQTRTDPPLQPKADPARGALEPAPGFHRRSGATPAGEARGVTDALDSERSRVSFALRVPSPSRASFARRARRLRRRRAQRSGRRSTRSRTPRTRRRSSTRSRLATRVARHAGRAHRNVADSSRSRSRSRSRSPAASGLALPLVAEVPEPPLRVGLWNALPHSTDVAKPRP